VGNDTREEKRCQHRNDCPLFEGTKARGRIVNFRTSSFLKMAQKDSPVSLILPQSNRRVSFARRGRMESRKLNWKPLRQTPPQSAPPKSKKGTRRKKPRAFGWSLGKYNGPRWPRQYSQEATPPRRAATPRLGKWDRRCHRCCLRPLRFRFDVFDRRLRRRWRSQAARQQIHQWLGLNKGKYWRKAAVHPEEKGYLEALQKLFFSIFDLFTTAQ